MELPQNGKHTTISNPGTSSKTLYIHRPSRPIGGCSTIPSLHRDVVPKNSIARSSVSQDFEARAVYPMFKPILIPAVHPIIQKKNRKHGETCLPINLYFSRLAHFTSFFTHIYSNKSESRKVVHQFWVIPKVQWEFQDISGSTKFMELLYHLRPNKSGENSHKNRPDLLGGSSHESWLWVSSP